MNKRLLPNPTTTNPTIDAYVSAVKRGLNSFHVTPAKDNRWAVKRASTTVPRIFSSQKEAVQHAQRLAKNTKTEVFIHRKDGTIRKRSSYSSSQLAKG
jgi:hypothetical protein